VRLIWVTKRTVAWLLVASGIALMTLRRIESLLMQVSGGATRQSELIFETVGLVISILLLAGIFLIKPLFSSIVRSEEELRGANARLSLLSEEQRILLNHTKDFIYRHDPQGMITYVSPAVEKITGFSPGEWLAHYTTHYTDSPVNKAGIERTGELLRTGTEGTSYVVEVRHKDGRKVWLEINKQPYVVDGTVAGVIGVARDITVRKRLEEEREKLIVELQEAVANIKTLRGMLPICASCKKIRDDKGYWTQIEAYVSKHSEAEFTHGICPECAKKLYPEYYHDAAAPEKK
jgi:PAS domain S-box-containing protein